MLANWQMYEVKIGIYYIYLYIYLLYKAEKPSVRPSVRPSRLYLDVSELIDFKLSQARITKRLGTRSFFLKISKCFRLPSGEL